MSDTGRCYVCGAERPMHTLTVIGEGVNYGNQQCMLCPKHWNDWIDQGLSANTLRRNYRKERRQLRNRMELA